MLGKFSELLTSSANHDRGCGLGSGPYMDGGGGGGSFRRKKRGGGGGLSDEPGRKLKIDVLLSTSKFEKDYFRLKLMYVELYLLVTNILGKIDPF